MKILSKRIVVPKTYETVYQIIKSGAYHLPKGIFSENSFSMYSAKRFKGGIISLIPVKGTISQHTHLVEVTLSIHADFGFCLGSFLSLSGIMGLLWCAISHSYRWIPVAGIILLGFLLCGQSIWEGKALLDRLEHRLLN